MRSAGALALLLAASVLVSAFPKFDHIFVIIFENKGFTTVQADPNFSYYAKLGVSLKNYKATTHPSQPNYLSMVAGDSFHADNSNIDLDQKHLGDLLEAKLVTWKTYQQGYPGNCFTGAVSGRYARKHNPFISFKNINTNLSRCNAHIVDATVLDADLDANRLPQFSLYTPDLDNDGHDQSVTYAGAFLKNLLEPRLPKFPQSTLIVITWDEDNYDQGNRILTSLLDLRVNDGLPAAAEDETAYNHYSLLRTIEENWNLGSLEKNDATAVPFDEKTMKGPARPPRPPPGNKPAIPPPSMPIGGMIAGFSIAFILTIVSALGFMYKTEIKQWYLRMRGRGFERVGVTGADGDRFEAETMNDVNIDLDDDDSLEQ